MAESPPVLYHKRADEIRSYKGDRPPVEIRSGSYKPTFHHMGRLDPRGPVELPDEVVAVCGIGRLLGFSILLPDGLPDIGASSVPVFLSYILRGIHPHFEVESRPSGNRGIERLGFKRLQTAQRFIGVRSGRLRWALRKDQSGPGMSIMIVDPVEKGAALVLAKQVSHELMNDVSRRGSSRTSAAFLRKPEPRPGEK